MRKERVKVLIDKLFHDMEEEDISISLFLTFYQNEEDLKFFTSDDRARVLQILKILSDDSKRHQNILEKLITHLGQRLS